MGIELEWLTLFGLCVVGNAVFGVFEVETPWWRRVLKWGLVAGLTAGVYAAAGHWALLAVALPAAVGLAFHFAWCRRHAIHPFRATPRRRYYALRGWEWPE